MYFAFLIFIRAIDSSMFINSFLFTLLFHFWGNLWLPFAESYQCKKFDFQSYELSFTKRLRGRDAHSNTYFFRWSPLCNLLLKESLELCMSNFSSQSSRVGESKAFGEPSPFLGKSKMVVDWVISFGDLLFFGSYRLLARVKINLIILTLGERRIVDEIYFHP